MFRSPFKSLVLTPLVLGAALFSQGCGPPPGPPPPGTADCASRLAGDIVISEFMVNPAGEDSGKEYLELYNATSAVVQLEGITLRYSRKDGSAEKKLTLKQGTLAPGGYFVLGDVRDGAPLPGYVDDTYGASLGAFNNSDGKFGVLCGTLVIDEVTYGSVPTKDNTAKVLDGRSPPDAVANDDENRWCDSPTTTSDFKGSPRAANASCGGTTSSCAVSAGALVVTEIMADPPGADLGREWFEVYNDSEDTVDLSGLTLRFTRLDGSAKKEVKLTAGTVGAGSFFTFGDAPADAGLPEHIDQSYGTGLGALSNTDGVLSVVCGSVTVDSASYSAPKSNASRGFDGQQVPDATANDDLTAWCDAKVAYTSYEQSSGPAIEALGTPGAANEVCATVATGCIDPSTQMNRPLNPPQAQRLIFTEFMPSPGTPQADREWLELLALDDMDLNGVVIARGTQTGTSSTRVTIQSEECIAVTAGTYVLLAKKTDPAVNGGLPAVVHTFGFSLVDNDTLFASSGTTLLDKATYSAPGTKKSAQLSGDRLEHSVNDSPYAWCPGTNVYGTGTETGTPGAANGNCTLPVGPGECRDSGASMVRAIARPVAGDLALTEVMPAPTPDGAGTERPKEWFEVLALANFDLNEVEFTNASGGTPFSVQQAECRPVTNGEYLLFAQTLVTASNGGLPTPTYTFDFDLFNSGSGATPERAVIIRQGTTELDRFGWMNSSVGASIQLSASVTPSPVANDVAANRCDTPAGTTYGAGDRGTPGSVNVVCP